MIPTNNPTNISEFSVILVGPVVGILATDYIPTKNGWNIRWNICRNISIH